MNYTEFRQAVTCLVDKDGILAIQPSYSGPLTRIDTQMPRPVLNDWVDLNPNSPTCVSKYDANGNLINKCPYDYNETHALEILWTNGWYSHITYPTLASLLSTPLPLPVGSVIYPSGHPRAGQPIDTIVGCYTLNDLLGKAFGEAFTKELQRLGMNVTTIEGLAAILKVRFYRDYDFATVGNTFNAPPTWFLSMATPAGIYSGGPNFYMIDDANLTYWATLEYPNATSFAQSMNAALMCQYIEAQEAYFVPLYSRGHYIAYRTGMLGVIDTRGYGLTANLDLNFLNMKNSTSNDTICYGAVSPRQINPVFGGWLSDYQAQISQRIFTECITSNPYKPFRPGKNPGGDLPWMAYDWKYENITDPTSPLYGDANVTYWFRQDTTWHDGVNFTVDDWNYTIYLNAVYGDSWDNAAMMMCVNHTSYAPFFQRWDNWTCSIQFTTPSIYNIYTPMIEIVPMHRYQYIAIPPDAPGGGSTTGLHGEWPGKNALPSQIIPNPYFTWSQLTGPGGEQYTWIGTNMWMYENGTYVSGAGGGSILDAYPDFWMREVPGEIAFWYFWFVGLPPQGGYYKIGLVDLVMLANAYGTSGNPPIPYAIGGLHVWEPGCDMARPPCIVGLSDLVTLALNYGKTWGSNP
jgi:hypothetical protein